MQKFSKIILIFGIIAGVLVVGGLIGLLAGRSATRNKIAPANSGAADSSPAHSNPGGLARDGLAGAGTIKNPDTEFVRPPKPAVEIFTNWEDKVEEILGAEVDETNKVEQLLALFPHVPDASKAEVALHLSNLVGDENYAPLGAILKDATQPDDALDVLMGDLLNRPNSLKLPQLLEIAQNSAHPKADESKDILSLFLDEDYGDDWAKWRQKTVEWLKDNPD